MGGRKYIGNFEGGMFNGQGTMTYGDGTSYVGDWKNDMPNGQGTEYRADGSVLQSGFWMNGVFNKGR